jgi:hypothetical protein
MRIGIGALTCTYQPQITAAAQAAGIPPSLALAVATQESGCNQNAVSPAGATGIMQLMPATAAGLNVDPHDVNQNIQGGVDLLAQLMKQFNGNVTDVLTAYNCGPGCVGKANLPAETQNYIPSVQALQTQWDALLGTSDASPGSTGSSENTADTGVTDWTPLYLAGGLGLLALFMLRS